MNEIKYQYCTATEASMWSEWHKCGVNAEIAELLKTNEEVIIKPNNERGYDSKIYKYRVAPTPKYRMVITGPNGYNETVTLLGKPDTLVFEGYTRGHGWTETRVNVPRLNGEVYAVSFQEVYE